MIQFEETIEILDLRTLRYTAQTRKQQFLCQLEMELDMLSNLLSSPLMEPIILQKDGEHLLSRSLQNVHSFFNTSDSFQGAPVVYVSPALHMDLSSYLASEFGIADVTILPKLDSDRGEIEGRIVSCL